MTKFNLRDRVIDRDGYTGTVVLVTQWRGSTWYDVRFGHAGVAVRYDADLRLVVIQLAEVSA